MICRLLTRGTRSSSLLKVMTIFPMESWTKNGTINFVFVAGLAFYQITADCLCPDMKFAPVLPSIWGTREDSGDSLSSFTYGAPWQSSPQGWFYQVLLSKHWPLFIGSRTFFISASGGNRSTSLLRSMDSVTYNYSSNWWTIDYKSLSETRPNVRPLL